MEFKIDAAVKRAVANAQEYSPAAPSVQPTVLYEMAMAELEADADNHDPTWLHVRVVQAIDKHAC